VLDEMGHPSIPLSVISKAAELQFHYTVDKLLLGNRWLRKATGIQPKFPYMVDSFERRYFFCCLQFVEFSLVLFFVKGFPGHVYYICIKEHIVAIGSQE
jgi:hypothetical protein